MNSRKAHCLNSVVKAQAYSNSLSALPMRRGLKQHWRTKLKSSVWQQHWHPRILGNAIQAQERSIVRITIVRGKGKPCCTITNCFQTLSSFFLFFFYLEQVITKIECRHCFSRIILFSLKCRISGHSPKSETRPFFLSTHLLPICCICEINAYLQHYCTWGLEVVSDWWKIAQYFKHMT